MRVVLTIRGIGGELDEGRERFTRNSRERKKEEVKEKARGERK